MKIGIGTMIISTQPLLICHLFVGRIFLSAKRYDDDDDLEIEVSDKEFSPDDQPIPILTRVNDIYTSVSTSTSLDRRGQLIM